MATAAIDLRAYIRDIPDFPKKGIVFKDITPLLADGPAFRRSIEMLAEPLKQKQVTKIVGIESRGFIFGGAVAEMLGVGFIPVRKKGKLPHKTLAVSYSLEYGTDSLEMHVDPDIHGERVAVIDDVLATGGTAKAVAELIEKSGAQTASMSFLIELLFLNGREKLSGWPLHTLIPF